MHIWPQSSLRVPHIAPVLSILHLHSLKLELPTELWLKLKATCLGDSVVSNTEELFSVKSWDAVRGNSSAYCINYLYNIYDNAPRPCFFTIKGILQMSAVV